MKKSHLGLAISAALLSGSVFAEGTLNLNKKSYAIIAPEQQQVASATNGVASLIEARVAKLADIQLKVKSRLEQAGIKVTKQLKNLAAISLADLSNSQVKQLRSQGYTVEEMGTKQLIESDVQSPTIQEQSTPWGIDRVRSPEAWADNNGTGV